MTRAAWWLIEHLSRLLERDERDAVMGDLAESQEPCLQALRDVLSLVVRRQMPLCADWHAWIVFLFLVGPFGMLLSLVSSRVADSSAIYFWLYGSAWNLRLLDNPGFRSELAHCVVLVAMGYLTLACWSWSIGLVLGGISRRLVFLNGILFSFTLLCGKMFATPLRLHNFLFWSARNFPNNAQVFAAPFYRLVLPVMVQMVLVAIPLLWGMRQSARMPEMNPPVRSILRIAAITGMAVVVMQSYGFIPVPYDTPGLWAGWPARLLEFVVYWPILYLAVRPFARHRQSSMALA